MSKALESLTPADARALPMLKGLYDSTAMTPTCMAVRHNYIVGLGDSNMAGQSGMLSALLDVMVMRSNGVLRKAKNAGVGGEQSYKIAARVYRDVISISPRPGIVVYMSGTNNVGDVAQIIADDRKVLKELRAAGGLTLYLPIYPINGNGAAALAVNAAKQALAAELNYPLILFVDYFSVVGNPDGTWKAGMNLGSDTVHASNAGTAAVADAVNAVLLPLLAPIRNPRPMSGDPASAILNGTFDQGAASGGAGAGWFVESFNGNAAPVPSVVAPTGGDDLRGNYQRLLLSPGSEGVAKRVIPAALLAQFAGRRVLLVSKVKVAGLSAVVAGGKSGAFRLSMEDISGNGVASDYIDGDIDGFFVGYEATFNANAGGSDGKVEVYARNPTGSVGNVEVLIGEVALFPVEETAPVAYPPSPTQFVQYKGSHDVQPADQVVTIALYGGNMTANLPDARACVGLRKTFKRWDDADASVSLVPYGDQRIDDVAGARTILATKGSVFSIISAALQDGRIGWIVV